MTCCCGSCTLAIWVLKLSESETSFVIPGSCTLAIWVLKLHVHQQVFHQSCSCTLAIWVLKPSVSSVSNCEKSSCTLAIWVLKHIVILLSAGAVGFLYARYMGIETRFYDCRNSFYCSCTLAIWVLKLRYSSIHCPMIVLVRSLYGY